MESARLNSIQSNYRDLRRETPEKPLFANVVLIDRVPHHKSILYMPRRDIPDAELSGPRACLDNYLGKDAFVAAGPVAAIDRSNKRIYLVEPFVVSYNHLIVCTAPHGDAFLADETATVAAVQALADALRCLSLRPLQPTPNTTTRTCLAVPSEDAGSAALLSRLPAVSLESGYRWSATERRLYEVQT